MSCTCSYESRNIEKVFEEKKRRVHTEAEILKKYLKEKKKKKNKSHKTKHEN
jgi:hypothetical protein